MNDDDTTTGGPPNPGNENGNDDATRQLPATPPPPPREPSGQADAAPHDAHGWSAPNGQNPPAPTGWHQGREHGAQAEPARPSYAQQGTYPQSAGYPQGAYGQQAGSAGWQQLSGGAWGGPGAPGPGAAGGYGPPGAPGTPGGYGSSGGYDGLGGYAAPTPGGPSSRGPGFLRALFDFSFRHSVTVGFAKVIYILAIVVAVVGWVLVFLTSLGGLDDPWVGGAAVAGLLGTIFLGIPLTLLWIVLVRVGLEVTVATVRTADNTARLVELGEDQAAAR